MILDEKYKISGMSCAACSARVDKAVRKLEGIKEVNVNLLTNFMVVSYDESTLSSSTIIDAVKKAGYGAKLYIEKETVASSEELEDTSTPILLKRFIASFILLIPLFYLAMGFMLSWPIGDLEHNLLALALIEMSLSLAIMIINHKFFVNGFKAIIHRSMNMDTLVALGSGTAFIYSFVLTIIMIANQANGNTDSLHMIMMNISYETAGMVPTLITIGKTLESYSKGKTTTAIKSLMDLSPKTALVIRDDKEVEILVNEVRTNDIFIVKPGFSIPVDGEVIYGESSIDESMLTGESIPVFKGAGDLVKSGTINQNGTIKCKAVRVGKDTTLNQIISLVEKAGNSKAKISQIVNKVSGIFVPAVVIIALLVFTIWMIVGQGFIDSHDDISSTLLSYAIERAIAVLVISCPCALGLATPVAIMVGSGKGARNGVLFKSASIIEEAGKINYLVLDKTGTITKGEPEVSDIITNIDEKEFLSIVASLEHLSEHPLALSINKKAKEMYIKLQDVTNFKAISGKGVQGEINNTLYRLGNQKLIDDNNIDISKYINDINRLSNEGKSIMILSCKDKVLGLIAVSDVIKEDSIQAIENIKNLGITPIMLTGDNYLSASYIAKQVGIEHVISDVLPEGKYDVINKIKEYGKVMMVGDGINDAVALTSANVGVGIGKGSDVAIESADIVLMKSSLMDVYGAIRLSQYVYLNIKENLFWAFIYNVIMIPIAAGAFSMLGLYKLAPWMGSLAMALSSVFVVLNALRINLFNPYRIKRKKHKEHNLEFLNINECNIESEENKQMEKVIKVKGMMCMHCVAHVKEALSKVEGVKEVEVSLEKGEARLTLIHDIDNKVLEDAIKEAGYEVL